MVSSKKRQPDRLVQLKFRIPESLRAKLAHAAIDNGLTLADEIKLRLSRSFEEWQRMQELIEHMHKAIPALNKLEEARQRVKK